MSLLLFCYLANFASATDSTTTTEHEVGGDEQQEQHTVRLDNDRSARGPRCLRGRKCVDFRDTDYDRYGTNIPTMNGLVLCYFTALLRRIPPELPLHSTRHHNYYYYVDDYYYYVCVIIPKLWPLILHSQHCQTFIARALCPAVPGTIGASQCGRPPLITSSPCHQDHCRRTTEHETGLMMAHYYYPIGPHHRHSRNHAQTGTDIRQETFNLH